MRLAVSVVRPALLLVLGLVAVAATLTAAGEVAADGPSAGCGADPAELPPTVSPVGRRQVCGLAGDDLAAVYEVVRPLPAVECRPLGAAYATCQLVNIHLRDPKAALEGGDWRLYFHNGRRALRSLSAEVAVQWLVGDLHVLRPTAHYGGPAPLRSVPFVTEWRQVQQSDCLPRYWLVRGDGRVQVLPNTDDPENVSSYAAPIPRQCWRQSAADRTAFATAATRYAAQHTTAALAPAEVARWVIPTPLAAAFAPDGSAAFLGGDVTVDCAQPFANKLQPGIDHFLARLRSIVPLVPGGPPYRISIRAEPQLAAEEYRLDVRSTAAAIHSATPRGAFWALQTIVGLLLPGRADIPCVKIQDRPRFGYRGLLFDVARHFLPAPAVRRVLDGMAAYKLNTLLFHLSCDEGWRLAIPSLPELTAIGGWQCMDLQERRCLLPQLGAGPSGRTSGSGYYSVAEFQGLLRFAADRHITVLPVFDMPAHSRAALIAMRHRPAYRLDDPHDKTRYLTVQYYRDSIVNPCLESTYAFVQQVVAEVQAMYRGAGVALEGWHIGGDEVANVMLGSGYGDGPHQGAVNASDWDVLWSRSPACQALRPKELRDAKASLSPKQLQRYFVRRVSAILRRFGVPWLGVWSGGLEDLRQRDLPLPTAEYTWLPLSGGGVDLANRQAARGFQAVLATPDFLYFDHPNEADVQERGLWWATRFVDLRKVFAFAPENLPQNAEVAVDQYGRGMSLQATVDNRTIAGMQAHLWTETVLTEGQMAAMLFPRLLAFAERGWHRAGWERPFQLLRRYDGHSHWVDAAALQAEWEVFQNVVGQKELAKLDGLGLAYRVPPPGAVLRGPTLLAAGLPGLRLEYREDGGPRWHAYREGGVPVHGDVWVRAVSADGRRYSAPQLVRRGQ